MIDERVPRFLPPAPAVARAAAEHAVRLVRDLRADRIGELVPAAPNKVGRPTRANDRTRERDQDEGGKRPRYSTHEAPVDATCKYESERKDDHDRPDDQHGAEDQ